MAACLRSLSFNCSVILQHSKPVCGRFSRSTSKPNMFPYRRIMIGPRKLTFGRKTDFELLMNHLKLRRHEKFSGLFPTSFCAELLANRCEDMDYKMVRARQPFFLNYRVDILMQRVEYMEEMKLTPLQKRRHVEKNPPVLMLSLADSGFSVYYLRGLIHCGEEPNGGSKCVHFLYKCCPKLRSYVFKIESDLDFICNQLGITYECALKMAINMPCFLLWNENLAAEEFKVIHRDYGLPLGYNLDYHTALVYPTMVKSLFKLPYGICTNKPSPQLVNKLEMLSMSDILEYKFEHSQGKPGDLSRFLIESSRAEGANENAELTV